MPAKKGTGYPGRVVRKCVVELEENQGEKVKLLSFFSSSSSSPPEGRAATVFCPRGRYSNKSCMERVNETLLLKSRIRKTNVRMGHGRAIQSGKASTPSVTPGCKRMVVRASFLCMLNSSFRGKGSPVTAISTNEGGTTFQIDNPMQVLAITLGCCKAFSSDLEGQHALWEEYTARMLEIASRRLQCTRLSQEDMRIWRSFQKMLRSAEVCPARMAEVGDMGRGKKVKRGMDWIHEREWFLSHDMVGGKILDYKSWHECHEGEVPKPGSPSSPYSQTFAEKLPRVVEGVCAY